MSSITDTDTVAFPLRYAQHTELKMFYGGNGLEDGRCFVPEFMYRH